jgi:Raf kinase inhibitor-like YbhB/YbcL family protein
MQITSPIFKNNDYLPEKYTCDGLDINPPLVFSDIPLNTKSLALIVDDPDSPSGVWTHWLVWNINPDTKEILENSLPINAVEGITTWGESGYRGPCPSSGTHRYFFKLLALDIILDLIPSATIAQFTEITKNNLLTQAEIFARYSKKFTP